MIVVMTSFSSQSEAEKVADILVQEQLAACVHIMSPHLAVYSWKGAIVREQEINILIKTEDHLYPVVEARLKELHSYDVPMIYSLTADHISPDYSAWVNLQTKD